MSQREIEARVRLGAGTVPVATAPRIEQQVAIGVRAAVAEPVRHGTHPADSRGLPRLPEAGDSTHVRGA